MSSRPNRRLTCGTFDVPDLPRIMSSLVLDTGSPVASETASPSNSLASPGLQLLEEEDCEEQNESPRSSSGGGATGSGRTRLSRSSKSDCLLRMNRRVSMKPQRKTKEPKSASEEDIKKFYLNNKLTSAATRQNALETIFEEPSVVRNEMRLIGLKKLKRSMNCKDGLNVTKTTVARRKKIKTLFGGPTKKFNKLSMDAFLEHLQSMRSEEPEEEEDGYRSQPVAVVAKSGATEAVAATSTATC